MKRAAVLLALMATAGCAGLPGPIPTKQVAWVKVPTTEIQAVCTRLFGNKPAEGLRYYGCVTIEQHGCTIYAPDFMSVNDVVWMRNLGHELKHCFDGMWHP